MSKLKYFIIAALLRMASWLSLGAAQSLGRLTGYFTWRLPTKSRRITGINLSICLPEYSEFKREQLAKASLIQTGMVMFEVPLMWEWPVEKCLGLIQETQGLELIDEALASGQGLILLAPHLGNWELAGLFFSSRYKMAALYSPPKIREFEDYMTKVRGRIGSELVRGDRRGLARLVTILREGGVAGILPDQSPKDKGSAFAPFFGIEVKTMTLVSKLIQRTGANALITYAERLPNAKGFRIVVQRAEPEVGDKNLIAATTALNKSVEQCVREIPEQYQWEYKRFRHLPVGQINPYNSVQIRE